MERKNITQKDLNKLIFESIKKVLRKKGTLNEGFKIDFQKMGPPSKYPNFITNIESGGSFRDKRLTYGQDKYKRSYKALKDGNYTGSAKQAIAVLRNFGYTDEEIKYAIDNNAFIGTDENGISQMNILRNAFNNVGKNPQSPYMNQNKKQFTLRQFCDAAELSYSGLVNVDELINAIKEDGIQFNENGTGNYEYWKEWFTRNGKYFGQNYKKIMDKINTMEPYAEQNKNVPGDTTNTTNTNVETEQLTPAKNFNEVVERINTMRQNSGGQIGNRARGKNTYGVVNDRQYNIQSLVSDSTSLLNGTTNLQQIIQSAWNNAKPTIRIARPKDYATIETFMNNFLKGSNAGIGTISYCLGVIQQVLQTSRNEMPVVMGLQKALNYFGIKDSKGRPFKVDGIIGPETSTALKNAGFKDIYEWKQTIFNYQQKHNVPPTPDGKVGNNTLNAFRNSNLTSIDMLNRYKPGQTQPEGVNQNTMASVSNKLNNVAKQPVTLSQPQGNGPRPGTLAESKKKVKIDENTLNKLILESIKRNLKKK